MRDLPSNMYMKNYKYRAYIQTLTKKYFVEFLVGNMLNVTYKMVENESADILSHTLVNKLCTIHVADTEYRESLMSDNSLNNII